MSLEKQLFKLIEKANDLEKQVKLLERDAFIERGSCKRNLMRKNASEAVKNAETCIGLVEKCNYLTQLSERIKNFVRCINSAIINQRKYKRDIKPLVSKIEHSINTMNYNLLELHLELFEVSCKKNHPIDENKTIYLSCLVMFRKVPEQEINILLTQLAIEVKNDEVSFLYERPPENEQKEYVTEKVTEEELFNYSK